MNTFWGQKEVIFSENNWTRCNCQSETGCWPSERAAVLQQCHSEKLVSLEICQNFQIWDFLEQEMQWLVKRQKWFRALTDWHHQAPPTRRLPTFKPARATLLRNCLKLKPCVDFFESWLSNVKIGRRCDQVTRPSHTFCKGVHATISIQSIAGSGKSESNSGVVFLFGQVNFCSMVQLAASLSFEILCCMQSWWLCANSFFKGNHKHFHISEAILTVGSAHPLTLKPTMRAIFTILTAVRTVATMCRRTYYCGNNLGVVKRSMATMWAIFTIWCHFWPTVPASLVLPYFLARNHHRTIVAWDPLLIPRQLFQYIFSPFPSNGLGCNQFWHFTKLYFKFSEGSIIS